MSNRPTIGYCDSIRCSLFTCQMEGSQDTTWPDDDTLDGCIWLTEEQIDAMMLQLNNETTQSDVHSRQKRTLVDFTKSPFSRWSTSITYKFDGSHCEYRPDAVNRISQFRFLNILPELSKLDCSFLF